ncbi:unnamed protein product [Lasius platythorax]|uniref:Uncharacterized protein n=1 Tax=Lasius platythorax TaxID=488582 RepID=A0AAV2N4M5_9HYME
MTSRRGRVQCDSRDDDDDDDDDDDNAKLKMRLEANGYERRQERNEAGVGFRAWASIRGLAMWKTMPGIRVNALFMRHFIDEDDEEEDLLVMLIPFPLISTELACIYR